MEQEGVAISLLLANICEKRWIAESVDLKSLMLACWKVFLLDEKYYGKDYAVVTHCFKSLKPEIA